MDLSVPPGLVGWTPIRVAWSNGRPVVDWCHTEGVDFTDPFFDESVQRCLRHPFRLLFRHETTMEGLGRFVDQHPGLPLGGFVFHMSRCGSTLVSQMLAAVPEHRVLSEPSPLDSVLRAHHACPEVTDDERATWLRSMVAALGQARGAQNRLFVKLDAWSTLELDLIRRTFPEVPWLFLFRDPVEVLVSQSRQLGAHVIPGVLPAATFGMEPTAVVEMAVVDYAAQVLARICEAALERADDPLATFVNYADLPGFVVGDMLAAWSIPLSDDGVGRMLAAAGRDAKNPVLDFDPAEPARRRAAASPQITAAAERWLAPVHERLQSAREASRGRVGARAL